jgi:hypothetical protein
MKWEYKTIKLGTKGFLGGKLDTNELENYMNELGRADWELVTAFDTNQECGATRDVVAIFKRPQEPSRP